MRGWAPTRLTKAFELFLFRVRGCLLADEEAFLEEVRETLVVLAVAFRDADVCCVRELARVAPETRFVEEAPARLDVEFGILDEAVADRAYESRPFSA